MKKSPFPLPKGGRDVLVVCVFTHDKTGQRSQSWNVISKSFGQKRKDPKNQGHEHD